MRKLILALALISVCTIAEAAKKFPMTATSIVPAAKGELVVDEDKNGNVRLKIEVEHLSNPQNLTPPAAAYIVWLQEKSGSPQNLGLIRVDKNLNASFEASTTSRSFELFITGERDANAKFPGGPEVFRANVKP